MPPRPLRTVAVVVLVCAISVSVARSRELTFDDRVAAQEAIERVYYSHQIGATQPFEEAVPQTFLRKKVSNYLQQSAALEQLWKTPVTATMLRRELERMARDTRMPERLAELFAALDDDPLLIQECLVRAALVDRLTRDFHGFDPRFHADAKAEAEALRDSLADGGLDSWQGDPRRTVAELSVEGGQGKRWSRVVAAGPSVEESRGAFRVHVVLERNDATMQVATYHVEKVPWGEWWTSASRKFDPVSVEVVAQPGLNISAELGTRTPDWNAENVVDGSSHSPCSADDTWDNGSLDDVPDPRIGHTAVWTGSLMLVWGGRASDLLANPDRFTYYEQGGRYDPATDTWTPISSAGAPSGRYFHTAVWTGDRMVVWGGAITLEVGSFTYLDTGGRYDPTTDTWSPTSTVGAPSGRHYHTALWTGSRMAVWGGYDGTRLGTGGLYDPVADSWTPTTTTDAPSARSSHSAVWTGERMIVWGGAESGSNTKTGALYDPAMDSWTPTSIVGAPRTRSGHVAVWTGNLMIVWGGSDPGRLVTGGRYDPVNDSWTPTSLSAPFQTFPNQAIWTGSEMMVWGGPSGSASYYNTGERYDPVTDTWTQPTTAGAPEGRASHTTVWTGDRMVVWGGHAGSEVNTGGRYDPVTDSWTPTSTGGAPDPRAGHTTVWSGNLVVVWGGHGNDYLNTGARYDPAIDTWTETSWSGLNDRTGHTAVWTGTRMLIWGGYRYSFPDNYYYQNTGAGYDPVTDTWSATSTVGAPLERAYHTAVWTGSRMVVWGGTQFWDGPFYTGGRYDPSTDTWMPTSTVGAPMERSDHTAVWSSDRMVVWGGARGATLNTGGRYDPVADSWAATSTVGAPSARFRHTALSTGNQMVIWGGSGSGGVFNTGGRYDPVNDLWEPTSMADAPSERAGHTAVWTGDRMVVWGGEGDDYRITGGRYDPVADNWAATTTVDSPSGRTGHGAVWTGSWMMVWGGKNDALLNTGGRYALGHSTDDDLDGFSECDGDCNDDVSDLFPGAPEINDGLDNQCPGDWGYGLTDEIASSAGFRNPGDANEFSWDAQTGATSYEAARATTPDFSAGCVSYATAETAWVDADLPVVGVVFYYLARASAPHVGSWGKDSAGIEREFSGCGAP